MSAIRLARGFTRRDLIIKFDGCYHGHADSLLVKAGSGALTFGAPDSAGVPAAFTQHTRVLPFNDPEAVKAAFAAHKGQVAGIILEPVPGNAGLYLPQPGYLEFLREITAANGALLIFDSDDRVPPGARGRAEAFWHHAGSELLWQSDWRRAAGGRIWRARARLVESSRAAGAGGAQAGTLSGNPLAMAAGLAALEELAASDAYAKLEQLGARRSKPE